MARIGWADAHARRRVGDLQTFEVNLLGRVQSDLIANTWLTERYNFTGQAIRTPFYHEYPSLVAMMLREIRYGIQLGLKNITVDPFLPLNVTQFHYHVGSIHVDYEPPTLVLISVPGFSSQVQDYTYNYFVAGLQPLANYSIKYSCGTSQQAATDANGNLQFRGGAAQNCETDIQFTN